MGSINGAESLPLWGAGGGAAKSHQEPNREESNGKEHGQSMGIRMAYGSEHPIRRGCMPLPCITQTLNPKPQNLET